LRKLFVIRTPELVVYIGELEDTDDGVIDVLIGFPEGLGTTDLLTVIGEFLITFFMTGSSRGFSISVGCPSGPTYNTEGTPETGSF
jgi:hypothetical protein